MKELENLQKDLINISCSHKANTMKKYMKDNFEYLGIPSPNRREIQNIYYKNWFSKLNQDDKIQVIKLLWDFEHREFQYIAVDWLKTWKKTCWKEEHLLLLEFLLSNKAWWDSVDLLASNSLGSYFKMFPEKIEITCDKWFNSNHLWLQRSCIIFQLKYKESTNLYFLEKYINLLNNKKDFFIQKAIGWSLREYAKTNPKYVKKFVDLNNIEGLAKREALKHF